MEVYAIAVSIFCGLLIVLGLVTARYRPSIQPSLSSMDELGSLAVKTFTVESVLAHKRVCWQNASKNNEFT